MTWYAANFAAQFARESSEGSPPNKSSITVHIPSRTSAFTLEGSAYIFPLDCTNEVEHGPFHYEDIEALDLTIANDNVPVDYYHLYTRKASDYWTIISAAAAGNGVFSNGGNATIRIQDQLAHPWGDIYIAGNALVALQGGAAALPDAVLNGTITLTEGAAQTMGRFCEFVNIPPDTSASLGNALDRLNRLFRNGATRVALGVRSDGSTAYANDCGLALMPPSRRIFLRASDFGNLPEQIPNSILDNTTGHFRFFPGVFFRRNSYVRSITTRNAPVRPYDSYAINAGPFNYQPFNLSVVNRSPLASAWRIVVDGVRHEIWITHPAGSDFRTALEIWNGVWVPILQQREGVLSYFTAQEAWDRENMPSSGNTERILIHRIRYLQYAELLAVTDYQDDITTDTPQTNTEEVN